MNTPQEQSPFSASKPRRKTRTVMVGGVGIGGDNPVRVQTMTNTDTLDIEGSAAQIARCVEAGSELVRLTTQTPRHAKALEDIRKVLHNKYAISVPLIADIHFSPPAAFEALKWADKVRLNPGNLLDGKMFRDLDYSDESYKKEIARIEEGLMPFIDAAKKAGKPIRIGANHGSLSDRILGRYGDTPKGMVESAMEYLRIFHKHGYDEIIVAMKAADPLIMIEANRLLASMLSDEKMDYPIHLGVTEAGNAEDGRAKSTIGIGTILLEGIGDTVRVSLTEDPEKEIPVCYAILQATRRRITKTEFVSCPSCGRTLFNLEKVTNKIKERMGHLKGVRIAIMGCIVNGLGEMADADFGYVGGKPGMVSLYWKKELIKRDVAEADAIEELVELIKSKNMWVEK
ncbi:MAG: (E)-4-hydroxy-3-methylbut-2-enyl-diphosphate synthase [Candidatus Moranbacteria bacterium]|nr:(E)-4-hydroxy-3-methylbut-2-enyl-diphosphate synthase [Candidatus Moranbacteria bacterium]